jgi:diguanylate cyclase (GGDEF)-like protein/PAS domain S-box-containing protein
MQTSSSLKRIFNVAIKTSLLQIIVPVLLIVFAITFQIDSLKESQEQQLARTRLNAQEVGATLAASIAGAFQNIDLTLLSAGDYIRNKPTLNDVNLAKLNTTLIALQRRVPSLILLRAANANGDVLIDANADNSDRVNVADRDYFQRLKTNPNAGMVISEPVIGRYTKKWVIVCARRFNLSNGEFGGVVYGSIELEGLTERLSGKEMKLSENDAFVLRDDKSNIIIRYAHRHEDPEIMGKKISSPNIVAFDQSGANSVTYVSNSVIDKVARVFYLQRIKDQPLTIVIGLSIDDALASWQTEARRKWVMTAIFILVVTISFFLIFNEQSRKLKVIHDLESTSEKLKQLFKFNEALLLNSPLPMGVYARDGRCIKANEALAKLIGTSRDVMLTKNVRQISAWETSGSFDICLDNVKDNSHTECEVHLATEYGKQVIGECHVLSIQQNQEQHLLIQFIDLTEIKQVNSKLENILKSMKEGVHVIDGHGMIILENDAAIAMLGWHGENLIGRPAHFTLHHHHADLTAYPGEACPINATLQDGKTRQIDDDVFWRKDGTFFPVEYTATSILNPNGGGNAVTVVFRDITYRKQLEDELRRQATHDVLTALPNRRLLMDRLGQAINMNRRQNTHGALLFLDLDKFKGLNDQHGHEAGDNLLIEVAIRLRQLIRESDTIARLGGDEFIVLLLGLDSNFDLAQRYVDLVVEKLNRRLCEEYFIGDITHRCTVSIGIKIFYHDAIPEQILRDADSSMYRVKKNRDPI